MLAIGRALIPILLLVVPDEATEGWCRWAVASAGIAGRVLSRLACR